MLARQLIHRLFLVTVRDNKDQEGHAVWVVLAQAEPFDKLWEELGPPWVVHNHLQQAKGLQNEAGSCAGTQSSPYAFTSLVVQSEGVFWLSLCAPVIVNVYASCGVICVE